ncbi:MAG TPA: ABC transporter substrate-binding protein [Microlunatus sp.]
MSESRGMSRRNLLQVVGLSTLGAAGVTAAAGCSPAEPSSSNSAGASGGAKKGGEFHGGWPYLPSPQGNYNFVGAPYVPVPNAILFGGPYGDLIAPPSAYYHWKEQTWEFFLADSYELDKASNTYTVKIKSGLKWSDGSALSSKDYVTTFWCQWAMNSPLWSYIDKIDAPDDTTFTMRMNQPAMVVERYLLRSNILPTSVYGDFADRAKTIQEGGKDQSSSEGGKLNSDLVKFTPKEYVASGPYNIDFKTINNTQLTLVKNETGFNADTVNFDKLLVYNGETPVVTPLVLSKDVDYATHGFPVASEKQFKNIGYDILRPPTYSGPALYMSFDKVPEFLADPKVRQALNYAFDHKQNGTVALGESGVAPELYTGFSDNLADAWLDPSATSKLIKYTFDQDKAASLLEGAGWKRSGNSWKLPNGKSANYQLLYPSDFADWSAAAKDLSQQLTKFGIKISLHGVVSTQQPIDVDKGNFQLAIQGWGNSTQPYPYFSYVQAFLTHNYPIAKNNGGKGINFPLKTTAPGFGSIDIQKMIDASGSGIDEAALKKNIANLAEVFNQLLPVIPLFERHGNSPALNGDRVKQFPTNDEPITQNSLYADNEVMLWILNGKLQPV